MWGLGDCVHGKVLSAPTTADELLAVIHGVVLSE